MWMFSQIGFFSAVEYDPYRDPDRMDETSFPKERPDVMVRARVKRDLTNLIELHTKLFADDIAHSDSDICTLTILTWKQRDYPYRVLMSKYEWGKLAYRLSMDIDYTNYKDRVKKKQGDKRASAYMSVWSAMAGLERKIKPGSHSDMDWWDRRYPESAGARQRQATKKKVPARKSSKKNGGKKSKKAGEARLAAEVSCGGCGELMESVKQLRSHTC